MCVLSFVNILVFGDEAQNILKRAEIRLVVIPSPFVTLVGWSSFSFMIKNHHDLTASA